MLGWRPQVIPYGIDDYFLASMPSSPKSAPSKVRFIVVCRLVPLKNIDMVLRNWSAFPENECSLTIIGDGPDRNRLEKPTATLSLGELVVFAGFLDKAAIRKRLLCHDVFVMPSAPETYGLVYAEAMAAGLPIVCARNNGFDGHISDGGKGL